VAQLHPGDIVFIPPDTEHGLRTPNGGRWLAIWPIRERISGKRYAE
jgi:quercetin dioxygenase-like cupin family protein